MGIRVTCSSSGMGVRTEEIILAGRSGLFELVLIWDKFDQEFIDISSIISLSRCGAKILPRVKIKLCVTTDIEEEELLNELENELPQSIEFEVKPLLNVGRAKSITRGDVDISLREVTNCGVEFQTILINYDGYVYACCSVAGITPALRLCKIHDLAKVYKISNAYKDNEIIKFLATRGWGESKFAENVKACGSKCTVCKNILSETQNVHQCINKTS